MKNFIHNLCILVLFFSSVTSAFAQYMPDLKNIGIISQNEKSAFVKLMQPHAPLIVNNYDLKYHRFFWFADPAQAFIKGSVTSYFKATLPMSSIQFELSADMVADSAIFHSSKLNVTHTGRVIEIAFAQNVAINAMDSVTVFYHGNPTITGFGSFGTEIHGTAPALWTLSEPYGASDWWPSKNDLTDKIDSIDVYVVTPNGNHVASNGLLISENPYDANHVLAHWKHRYPIASYLIAIATTNYARFSDYYVSGDKTLQILNYVYPEDSAVLRSQAATVLPAITLFEQLFTPYPYWQEKYGQAQFGWGGGMEHQTMTFLGGGAFNAEIIAHELAHQWFGDMITCGSWHDIWLNEGFATYCAGLRYRYIDQFYWKLWRTNTISYVTSQPDGSVYCDDTTNVNRIFDGRLTYSKGAILLHMLRFVVGDSNFYHGMRDYLNDEQLSYKFALTPDFIAHMQTASGRDLTGFFADWFYGQGYPSYNIQVSQAGDLSSQVTIYQSQSHSSVDFFEMPVEIRFAGEGKDTTIVFDNTFSGQTYSIQTGFAIDSAIFDPNLWLASKNNEVILGMNDLPAGKSLVIHPNPASDFIYVQHNFDILRPIEIASMDGKQIPVEIISEGNSKLKINIQNFKQGVYLIKIGYKEGTVTRKFVVNR